MTNDQMATNYYKAALTQRGKHWKKPDYVPKKIVLPRTVRSDVPFYSLKAEPGEYDNVHVNQWGAVSVDINGKHLGVKPNEFEVLEWQPNPKLENKNER